MKKIIRLTESDLARIVKRVIKEQETNSYSTYDKLKTIQGDMTGVVNFYRNVEQSPDKMFRLIIPQNAPIDQELLMSQDNPQVLFETEEGVGIAYSCKLDRLMVRKNSSSAFVRVYNKNYQEDLKKNYCGVGIKGDIVSPTSNPRYAMDKSKDTGSPMA